MLTMIVIYSVDIYYSIIYDLIMCLVGKETVNDMLTSM